MANGRGPAARRRSLADALASPSSVHKHEDEEGEQEDEKGEEEEAGGKGKGELVYLQRAVLGAGSVHN